jgi:hypothetical protein
MQRVVYTYRINSGSPGRGPGPIMRLLGGVLSLAALALAAFFGFFIFVAVAIVVVIGGGIFALRVWLLKRRIEREFNQQAQEPGARPTRPPQGDYIDVDFTEKP